MSDEKQVVRIEAKTGAVLKKYAEKKGVGVGDAADMMINYADARMAALARYQKNTKGEEAKPRKKKVAAAKKPRAKKKAAAEKAAV